jgi:hypothetical protein
MAKQLTLKVNSEPTMFNKEMLIGTLMFPMIGTIVGGLMGKRRMEDEKANGKVVTEEQTAWSKETIIGGWLGAIGGSIAGNIVGAVVATAINPVAGAIAFGAIALAGMGIGGSMGMSAGKQRQRQEFEQARQQLEERAIGGAIAQSQLLETSQGHGHGHNHTAALESQRSRSSEHVRG